MLDLCVFVKSTDFKICDVIISIASYWKLHLRLFLLNANSYQNKTWSNTSVLYGKYFYHVFVQCWRLETSSRSFYDFIKMTIKRDLVIFNSWLLPFLIVGYSHFQKNETLESWHSWLLSNLSRLLNWKGPGTQPQSSNCSKDSWKLLTLLISTNWPSLVT